METFDGRSSARTALLKLVIYAFVAAYTALFGKGRKEAIELTSRIAPRPGFLITGRALKVRYVNAWMLTCSIALIRSHSLSRNAP